jgi:hypothetical protein
VRDSAKCCLERSDFFLKFESPPNDRHKLGTAGHVDALAKVEEKNNPMLAFVSLISADGTENRLFFLITLSRDSDLEPGGDALAFRFACELFAIKEANAKGRSA